MGRIKICAAEEQVGKTVSSARDEFLRYCRLRNLSPRTIEFYREDIDYFIRWAKFKFADDITKNVLDNFVIHEMDKGNKVTLLSPFCSSSLYHLNVSSRILMPFLWHVCDNKAANKDMQGWLLWEEPLNESG